MLPTARRTPQHLSLRGDELEPIAAHPSCDVVHTRRHLKKMAAARRMTYTIYLGIVGVKAWAEIVSLGELNNSTVYSTIRIDPVLKLSATDCFVRQLGHSPVSARHRTHPTTLFYS